MQLGLALLVIALVGVSTLLVVGLIATATMRLLAASHRLGGLARELEEARPAWHGRVGEAQRRLLQAADRAAALEALLSRADESIEREERRVRSMREAASRRRTTPA